MQKKTKVIYDSVRKITGKQALRVFDSPQAVKDKDGVVLVNQEQIKKRWGEHFQQLYNPHTMTEKIYLMIFIYIVGQRCGDETATIMREEIEEAVYRLKKSKASGAEEIQGAGNSGIEILLSMCCKIWEEEKFP